MLVSAIYDMDTPRAVFNEALVQQTVNTLAEWLEKDRAVIPDSTPEECAEYLAIYFLIIICGRRRGPVGLNFFVQSVQDIIDEMVDDAGLPG